MDRLAVRAAFDEQVRRHPAADPPDGRVEHDGTVIRTVSGAGGWSGVTWSELVPGSADAVIAAQISRFADLAGPWEWKHYSYDQPPDLPDRLLAAGFAAEPAESLLVAEIADLTLDVPPPPGVELRAVHDQYGVDALVAVHDEVFGGHYYSGLGRTLLAGLASQPDAAAAVVAWAGQTPISAGRMEFHAGTEFASLWAGGTLPAWRGRGVFRSMVAHRAALAADRGVRYLQVDASRDSRPILQRLGFVELATTTPFTHPGGTR
jgi:GNAT superfamily N-acetyltransferase